MTKEEFEKYLIGIGGLTRTYGEDRGPIVSIDFFDVNEGWYQMISELIDCLLKLGWDKRVNQVKEKFGGLRFYIENSPEGGHELIRKYESMAYSICEKCGASGVLRKGPWLRTLCEEHSEGKEPMDKNYPNN